MPNLSFRITAEDATGEGLSKAHHDLDTLSEKSEHANESVGGLEGGLAKLGLAAAGVGAVMGAKEFLGDSVGAAENLAQSVSKLQRTIGGTAEDASRLKFALGESIGAVGGNADNANMALGRFAKGLTGLIENEDGTTTKSNALTDQLKAMGIAATDASGNALPMQQVLGQLADKFKDMPDGAQKTALAMQLFGRQGVDLIPFLNKGSEGIADLEKESDKLGLTLSSNTIQQTQKLAAAQRTFGEAMEGVKVQIGVALLPVLTTLAEQAGKFATFIASNVVPAIKDFAAWIGPQLQPYLTQAQAIIAQIVPQVVAFAEQLGQKLVPVIQTVVQWLQQHQVVLAAVAVAIGTLVAGPIAAFIAAAVLIAQHWAEIQPVVQRFIEYVQTVVIPAIQHWINDVFMPRFEALKTYITVEFLPKFQAALTNIKDIVSEVVQFIVDHWAQIHAVIQPVIDIVLPQLMAQFKAMKDTVETVMAVIKDIISVVLDVISGNWKGAWNDIKQLLDDVLKGIQSIITDNLTGIEQSLSAAWDTVKAAAAAAWEALKTGIEDTITALLDEIGKLPQQILSAIGDLSHLLYDAGAKVIQGFIDGIGSKVGDVKSGLQNITSNLTSWKGPPEKDAQLLFGAGQLTMQGYIDGIVSKIPDVKSALGRVSDEIAATAAAGFGGTAGSEDTARRAGGGNAIGAGSSKYPWLSGPNAGNYITDPNSPVFGEAKSAVQQQFGGTGPNNPGGGGGGGGMSPGNGTDVTTIAGNKKQYALLPDGTMDWWWLYTYSGGGNSRPIGQGIYEHPGGYDTEAQARADENNGGKGSSGGGDITIANPTSQQLALMHGFNQGTVSGAQLAAAGLPVPGGYTLNGIGVNNAPGFNGAPVPFPTNLPAAAPFPDHATLINVGIQNSVHSSRQTAGRGVAGGTQSYAALAARWGLEHNPALGRMLDGTEAGAQRAVEAFLTASGMGGGSAGPDWNAPIAPGSGIAAPAASGIPLGSSSGGGGPHTAPTIVINITALDAAGVMGVMPQVSRQLDLYLKGQGQTGILR